MATTTTPGVIWLGTIAKFTCFGIMYMCAKFHAFTTKCTIFLESAGLLGVSMNASITVSEIQIVRDLSNGLVYSTVFSR